VNLWPIYDEIRCPTLVVRGAESDLLTQDTAQEMTRHGPKAKLVEVPGVGHAPVFSDEHQIGLLKGFLLADG
jgi:pimeloyl-ACP methyl ester carboxylesterase